MNDELKDALERAAGDEPSLDLADQVWAHGRVVRRRRQVAQGIGGLAAAAVIVGAFALGGGLLNQPEAYDGPAQPTGADEAQSTAPVQTYALPTPTATPDEDQEPTETATAVETVETADPEATQEQGVPVATDAPVETEDAPIAAPTSEVAVPTQTATSSVAPPEADPVVECSATGMGGSVVAGDAPAAVVTRAQTLLDRAVACDRDYLVAAATADGTSLSFGLVSPEDAFVLPEPEWEQRFALLVQTLTAAPPTVLGGGDGDTYYTWYLTEDTMNWRVGFTPDGTWAYFIAGD